MARKRGSADARIAVDIGGTFTDLVLLMGGRVTANVKVLTTPSDPSVAVETGISRLLEIVDGDDVREVVHGTTLVVNALIERKGAVTGLVATEGFKDTVAIRRELRYDLYDLFLEMPQPLVPRRLRHELGERVLADGTEERPLDPEQVRRLARRLDREGVEAVAVALLHSYRNPEHEREVAKLLRSELPGLYVSLSSDVSPELGEFTRTSTAIANAYVLPLIDRYLEMLEKRLAGLGLTASLRIMLSTGGGGIAGVETARRFPVRLLESGPAAGAVSAGFWGSRGGREDVLAFDMGGTTAKACLIERGIPLVAREFEAARVYRFTKGSGMPIRVPVIDLIEIGAGGGSIAHVGPFGLPNVGPESTGADPGPACYGQGGDLPTVTDADLLLGYLNPDFFLGGDMRLDVDGARSAMQRLGDGLGLSVEETAAAVHRVVNENMASAARMHAIERGRDVRRCSFVATGGAGPVHAWGVARNLGIRKLVFPPSAGVASAFGMLTAAPGFELARSLPSALSQVRWSEVRRAIRELERSGTRQLTDTGIPKDQVRVEIAADVRHRGQGDPITVELGSSLDDDPAGQVERAFEETYVRLYGRRPPGVESEVMTWRVRVAGPLPKLDVKLRTKAGGKARKGTRRVWFAETDGY
ncbi:MAG TPA: hydantoinase/oxoprolinase family protein, partial [Actinomycetota bacterium]|nr:hydantoinase/oxoprolinase family protein [Actinomycetota bacterium]